MNSEEILKWKEAGKLARNALNFGKTLIQEGRPVNSRPMDNARLIPTR